MRWLSGAVALLGASALAGPLVTVPIELHKGMIFADVAVNGHTLKLVIDSAASRPALDPAKALEAGLNIDKTALHGGPHAPTANEVRVAESVTYSIGPVRVTEDATVVYPFAFLSKRIGHSVEGVFGGRMLRENVVEFDYAKREMRIWDPAAYVPPPHAHVIPAEMAGLTMGIRGSIAGQEGLFIIDTGLGGADVVFWNRCSAVALREAHDVTSTAYGGDRTERMGLADELRFGELALKQVRARVSQASPDGRLQSPACGNLGSGLFARFTTVLDVPHKRMVFVPNAVPFELHKGMIFLNVSVNGKRAKLAFDSDAPRSSLDLGKARELGINVDKVAWSRGTHADKPIEIHIAENVRYRIGEAEFAEPITTAYPLAFLAKRLERGIDGIVGNNIARKYVIEIDYAERELRFHDPDAFQPPANARAVPAEWVAGHIVVKGAVQGVDASFLVDTGVGGADAVLFAKCSSNPVISGVLRESREMTATAFGGDRQELAGRLDSIRIGDVEASNPSIRLSKVAEEHCGHVGGGFFSRFRTYFDLPHGRILLVPLARW